MSIQIVEIAQPSVIDTVAVAQPSTVAVVEIRQGPAGAGGGGSVAWDDITGTASDVPFLPVAAPAHSEGLVYYDSTDKSLSYYNDEADVTMNIGREMWLRVRNNSGAAILNGKVVYINDAIGQLPTIRLARADDAITSRVIGIATHDIGNNEFGYVTTTGEIKGLNTNAFDDGDLLFLSAVTAGEMTLTAPLAPNRVIQVATVIHAHPTQGKLYCHPETDSIPSTGIVDSTATGRALITAATPAAARTTLELAAAATAATPNTLVLRDASGGANFAGTVNMATGVIVDLQFEDYQAAVGATFTYDDAAASAHRTALRSGATGDALFTAATPAAANATLGRLTVRKTADEILTDALLGTRTLSTDFAADSQLVIPLEANTLYRIEWGLLATSPSVELLKARFTYPARSVADIAGGAISCGAWGNGSPSNINGGATTFLLSNHIGANQVRGNIGMASLNIGATPGNLRLEWGKVVAGTGNTTMLKDSYLIATKIV